MAALLASACMAPATAPGTRSPSAEPPVQLFAAASATDALSEIRDRYQATTGHSVELTFGASSTLARQIQSGAPADLFLSASTAWADEVERRTGTAMIRRRVLLGNRLVVIAPADSSLELLTLHDLANAEVAVVAIADPDSVPAGIYARQALEQVGSWESLRPRLIVGDTVRTALQYVATGSAPAGIVYATDARAEPRVRVVLEVPPELHAPIELPLLLLGQRGGPLYDYLGGDQAAAIFASHGFLLPASRTQLQEPR